MGQPKFPRKKYTTPNHPWQGDRIKEEHEIVRKFGLKNKREIWKAQTRLREIRGQARGLVSRIRNADDTQAHKEADQLLARLHRAGYTGESATLNEVLGLDMERILNRRLQSQVFLKGMARTMSQARQFVSHGLVTVGDRRVTIPSYVIHRAEEETIGFHPDAAVADETHPVRPKPEGYVEPEPVVEAEPEPVEEAAPEAAEATEAPAAEAAPEAAEATEAPAEETETKEES
jgi:small subunit ribosomal protein S4